jgi:hypothetical protein
MSSIPDPACETLLGGAGVRSEHIGGPSLAQRLAVQSVVAVGPVVPVRQWMAIELQTALPLFGSGDGVLAVNWAR